MPKFVSGRHPFALFVVLLAPLLLPIVVRAAAAPNISGLWDATVTADQTDVPFHFEIVVNGAQAKGFFFEGDRKVGSTSGTFQNGRLTLAYDFLNTTLDATVQGDQLQGSYHSNRPDGYSYPLRAKRFTPVAADAGSSPQVAGRWEMRRADLSPQAQYPWSNLSWQLYLRQSGAEVSGAILRVSGDTGMLTGLWKDGKLVMSHFAGERPLLFEAQIAKNGTLNVTLDGRYKYIAARTSQARASDIPEPPDPSRYSSVQDPTVPFHFAFPDMNGKLVSDTDPQFKNKVVILAIGGTWCPNCHDEAPFLAQLYKQFHARGLEIVGLSFEADADPAAAHPRMLSFIKRYNLPYPLLLAGTPDQVAARLPQLVNFGAFPTTIFLGRDGLVRRVHAGFASAATGAEHIREERQDTALVEQLLAQNPAKAAELRNAKKSAVSF